MNLREFFLFFKKNEISTLLKKVRLITYNFSLI